MQHSSQTTENASASASLLDHEQFARFAALVTRTLGIKMPVGKTMLLENRLRGRMRQLGISSLDAYEQYLLNSPHASEEFVHFCDAVTTNKTDFFREPMHFEYLRRSVLASPSRERKGLTRLWCAGCSSGQEAYTLAMVASEYKAASAGFDFSILGTDISTRVLDQAKRAVYAEELIEPVPIELRRKYLLRSKDRSRKLVRMRPELRRTVSFERLNFMDSHYGRSERFDVIFFRNVLIYFDKPTQEAVVRRLADNLVPGGYLFIGLSESVAGARVPLATVAPAILRKVP